MKTIKGLLVPVCLCMLLILSGCGTTKEEKTAPAPAVQAEKPMYQNGDFEGGKAEPWALFTQGGDAKLVIENGELCVDIANAGSIEYAVQLYQDVGPLEYACKYRMQFDMYSTLPRNVEYRIQMNGGTYQAYSIKQITLTETKQTFVIDFTMEQSNDMAPRLAFNMGYPVGKPKGETMDAHKIYVDNVSLTITDASKRIVAKEAEKKPDISVNLLGYRNNDKKVAVFRTIRLDGKGLDTSFSVYTEKGKKVFTGKVENPQQNDNAREMNAYGDFSEVKESGRYYIQSKIAGKSELFTIGETVYDEAFKDVVKMLYLQRCGTALDEKHAGDFAHPVCHNTPARIYGTETFIDVTGGWHDAGDYGRYVVPGVKAAADLLLAFMHYPEAFDDSLGIPESGNGIPDVLDEVRYELEWLLKMQDKSSGGVYHKVTCAAFPGFVMPEDETDELIISPVSAAATGDFAAVLAMASGIYEEIDKAFADNMRTAAEAAWAYLEANPAMDGFVNPKGIATGEYGDSKSTDERYWAAAELYKLTGDQKYHDAVKKMTAKSIPYGLGWQDVGDYGTIAYLTMNSSLQDSALAQKLRTNIFDGVRSLMNYIEKDGYKIAMGISYPWGSNMTVSNNAMLLLFADIVGETSEYKERAMDHLHYIFGRNPLITSYVTGHGTVNPQNPHHRPSEALHKTMRGMLVGGPNSSLQDPYAKAVLINEAPAKRYVDHEQSYSTNEICIYWNSPLVYLMAATIQ